MLAFGGQTALNLGVQVRTFQISYQSIEGKIREVIPIEGIPFHTSLFRLRGRFS